MPADVINLNKAHKARAKDARTAQAAENRAKFGQTKGQSAKTKAEASKLTRALDEARRDRPDKDR